MFMPREEGRLGQMCEDEVRKDKQWPGKISLPAVLFLCVKK